MIKVLIVEDDPMVAELNKQYVKRMEGFTLSYAAGTTEEAVAHMEETEVDLILLDVYMPGLNGIEFLRQIREQNQDVDVILITAATDMTQIQQSLRLGTIDYLIKPFEFERFQDALIQYKNNYYKLTNKHKVNQHELDQWIHKNNRSASSPSTPKELPKGLTKNTLQMINQVILSKEEESFSTEEISEEANISRVSVRKYLKFLSDIEYLNETLTYGVGRPIYQYSLNVNNQNIIEPYI